VDLSGRDFRFRPDTGEFEAIEGQTQFGRRRDDWGHWFGNNNPTWGWHYWLPDRYLVRNPTLAVPSTRQPFAHDPDATRVFPISRLLQRFNDVAMAYHVTSGCSVAPYRDELFGPDFATSLFISEPVHNLVHREVLEPDGVSFASHRAPDEHTTEFLASSDNWFRPITLKTGPDGALYVADMYRLVLEHPEWIPGDVQQQLDLRAGADRGRLYRVFPAGATLRPPPRLDRLSTRDLVRALDSPNGWQRDTAQRLLVERGDRDAVKPLWRLSRQAARPQTRLQALCTLDGLGAVSPDWLPAALTDAHPAVRRHAIRLCEPFLEARAALPRPVRERLQTVLLGLAHDADPGVRFQLALSLGVCSWPGGGRALAELAQQSQGDDKMLTAILTAAEPHLTELLPAVLAAADSRPWWMALSEQLVGLAVTKHNEAALAKALPLIAPPGQKEVHAWQFAALAGLLDALDRQHTTWTEFARRAGPQLQAALSGAEPLFVQARATAFQPDAGLDAALAAIRLLGRGPTQTPQDLARLAELLRPQWPAPIQQAALRLLARRDEALVADLLVSDWSRFGPDLRGEMFAVLLRRPAWTQRLLRALDSGQITPGQVHTTFRQKLLEHRDAAVREQARRLFAQVRADRRQVVEQYAAAERLPANAARGRELFRQNCAACHRLRGEGYEVGPDLAMTANKSFAALLTATLNPNDAVEARYLSYTATLKDGQELSGVIVATTPNNVTLRNQGGLEYTVLRSELQDLASTGLSLMPEGFENALSPQDLADLIAYLQAN
jgi:putative heme-binding domain-containing protein